MENNIIFIITFSEDENSEALKLLLSDSFPLKDIINKIKQKNFWNFHFNKSIIFPDSQDLVRNEKYNKQMNNFKNFIEKVKSLPKITISNEFIYYFNYDLLKNKTKEIEENIKKILNCKNNIKNTQEFIENLNSYEEIIEKETLSEIEYTLVCPICQNKELNCFDSKEKCKNCTNNCNFESHKIVNFKYKKQKIKLIEKNNELKITHKTQIKELNDQKKMFENYSNDYIQFKIEWFDIYDKLKEIEKTIKIIKNDEENNNENKQLS